MEDNGHWITLENGVHVLIKDGQSIDEALAEQFDTDDDTSFDSDEHIKPEELPSHEHLKQYKKHKDKTFEESALSINPGYEKSCDLYNSGSKTSEAYARTCNCFKCTVAAYFRIVYGLDVQAKITTRDGNGKRVGEDKDLWDNYILKHNEYRTWTEGCFNIKSKYLYTTGPEMREMGYKGAKGQKRYIKEECKRHGPGTFISITIAWSGTRKSNGRYQYHSVYAYNDNGEVKFFDSQSGKRCESYWDNNWVKPIETDIIKLNGLKINDQIDKYIERGEYETI